MNDYQRIYVDFDSETHRIVNKPHGGRKRIKSFRRQLKWMDIFEKHDQHKNWLEKSLNESKAAERIIVLTHHAPSLKMLSDESDPRYRNGKASDLETFFKKPITHWISGHTHLCKHIQINGVECISNCYGYPNEKTDFVASNLKM